MSSVRASDQMSGSGAVITKIPLQGDEASKQRRLSKSLEALKSLFLFLSIGAAIVNATVAPFGREISILASLGFLSFLHLTPLRRNTTRWFWLPCGALWFAFGALKLLARMLDSTLDSSYPWDRLPRELKQLLPYTLEDSIYLDFQGATVHIPINEGDVLDNLRIKPDQLWVFGILLWFVALVISRAAVLLFSLAVSFLKCGSVRALRGITKTIPMFISRLASELQEAASASHGVDNVKNTKPTEDEQTQLAITTLSRENQELEIVTARARQMMKILKDAQSKALPTENEEFEEIARPDKRVEEFMMLATSIQKHCERALEMQEKLIEQVQRAAQSQDKRIKVLTQSDSMKQKSIEARKLVDNEQRNDNRLLEEQKSALEEKIGAAQDHANQLSKKLAAYEQELSDSNKAGGKFEVAHQEEVDQLRAEHKSEIEKLTDVNEKLSARHQESVDKLETEHRSEIEGLESKWEEVNKKLSNTHQDEVDQLRTEHDSEIEMLKAGFEEVKNQLSIIHEDEIDRLKIEHNLVTENLADEMEDARKKLDIAYQGEANRLYAQIEKLKSDSNVQEEAQTTAEKKNAAEESRRQTLQNQIDSLTSERDTERANAESVRKEHEETQREKTQLQEELKSVRAKLMSLEDTATALTTP